MIIRGCLVFSLFLQIGLTANVKTRDRNGLTISECAAKGGECDESRGHPVCGTDDQTYPTLCHLLRVQCSGHEVSLKYRGSCKACKDAHEYALKHKAGNSLKFVPRCKPDGNYAPIQCLGDTGCWCSDITGKPIENTSVRIGKPKCRKYNKPNIRRSPARNANRGRRACNQADQAAFNDNLIKIFQSEYIRSGQHQRDRNAGVEGAGDISSKVFIPPADQIVLDWKFALLDSNMNQLLDKNEFRELKKLVKRVVKPRRCGRAFGKFCDVDEDNRMSHKEWNSCISKDGINRLPSLEENIIATENASNRHVHTSQNSKDYGNKFETLYSNNHQIHTNSHHNAIHTDTDAKSNHHGPLDISQSNMEEDESSQRLDYDDDIDYGSDDVSDDEDNLGIIRALGSSTNFPSIYFLRPNPDSPLKDSEGESDCLTDRTAALEEQRHGGTILYVPDCTADGRYQRIQCYRSTPYCWCVNEETGKNIPGTSVKDKRPLCNSMYPTSRPMKGCSENRKMAFLKDLKEFLKSHLLLNTNSGANSTKWSSEDERIATLSFVLLDKNKNKAWERKEWKTFRELIITSKTLRKCGKKMPRYCDVNGDKKITLSEWLNCLNTQWNEETITQNTTHTSDSITPKSLKLTGSNPLEQYLKD